MAVNEGRKGYKETKLGWIPKNWETQKISKLFNRVRKPVALEIDEIYQEIGIRSHGKGLFHKEPVTGEKIGNKSVFWIEPYCLILNVVFAWEQAVAKTTDLENGKIASHRFPMYKVKAQKADLDYVLYFFKTPIGKHFLGLASPGGAGRNKTLGQEEFSKLKIPLPPYPEQKKIAQILSTWDKAIELTEKLIQAKKRRKKGLMQQLLTGKKRFSGEERRWKKTKLRELLDINYGKSANGIKNEQGSYYVYGTGGVVGRTSEYINNGPAIIIGRKGTIDKPQMVKEPFWAIDTTFYCTPKKKICVDWLYHYLLRIPFKTLNEASGVPSLNRNTLNSIKVLIPRLTEQKKIASVLSACDKEIELLNKKLNALKQQKKGLMQKLLTGQVRV